MRTSRLNALVVGAAIAALPGIAAAQGQPSFNKGTLSGASLSQPTQLQFGPDGRLYVSQQNGQIKVFTVSRDGPASYSVTGTEVIELVRNIPNHNDDGSLETAQFNRMVTGLLVVGTPSNPVIYAASSDPRIAIGNDSGLDTNSGIISRLTWNGSSWDKLDIVRGLPRCEENHASNGMVIDEATGYMYLAQGGNTNMGAPSNNFGQTPEYALSAAILRIDLNAIGNSTYDIPTLDDPSRPNTGPGGSDQGDPFGGNDGANQAMIVAGGPVQVWAPGYRNPFDVAITTDGRVYTVDNGPNVGWGGPPILCSNASNENNSHSYGDGLHYVGDTTDANGAYGGHPTPFRAGETINGQSPIPPGTANAFECTYLVPGVQDGALHVWGSSTNGLVEYTASNFGGAMQGDLLAATWTGNSIERIILGPGGTTASVQSLFTNVGIRQLDVTAQGPGEVFAGTIWSCDHPGGAVYVFEPEDLGSCAGLNDPALDDDNDGYDNADEIASGTDPCSAGDTPADNDGDMIGDITDPDDDNDGIPDYADPYAIDATNGLSVSPPLDYGWAIGQPGFGLLSLGFTGLMTGSGVDYLDRFDPDGLTPGGAAGKFTVDEVGPGDAFGSFNSQDNAFQFGVNVSASTGRFVVASEVDAPFFSGRTPVGAESIGIYIGAGDQNNYVKIAIGTREGSSGVGVHLVREDSGIVSIDTLTPLDFSGATDVGLSFLVDPAAGTAQPRVSIDGGAPQDIGGPIALTGATLDVVQDPAAAMAVGIIATSRGGSPFAGTWDFFTVEPEGTGAEALVSVDPPGSQINGSTYGNGSFQIQNLSTDGQRITQVAFAVNSAILPDVVFDPNGTAGDTVGRVFTPDGNAGAVGLQSHTFAFPHHGGFQTLAVVFDDFEPGESFGFAVDMDPTTINGVSAPGPNESGSISGLELVGSYVRVEFDDGTIIENDLFRLGSTLDASSAIMRPGTRAAPTVDVLGVSEPAVVTSPGQTVRVAAPPGSDVRLLVVEAGLYLDGVPGGGFDVDPFEANSAQSIQSFDATVGAGGFVDIPITLTKSDDDAGISHLAATVLEDGGWTGRVSDTAVLQLGDEVLTPSPATLAFGPVVEGGSATLGLTLDAGGSAVDVTGLTVTGAGFSLVSPPSLPTTIPAGGDLDLTVAFSPTAGGSYSGQLSVAHSGNGGTLVVPLSGQGLTDSGDILHRINVGGPQVAAADASSPDWGSDTQASPSPYIQGPTSFYSVGSAITLDNSVPPQAPTTVFQSARWDPGAQPEMTWALPVASGTTVEVRVYLAETFQGNADPGDRVFDVTMEGGLVFDDVDMAAMHGLNVGFALAHQLTVNDGTLDIQFVHQTENPQLAGLEVVIVDGGSNTPPVAGNDSGTAAQGGQVVIPVLANDSDADGSLDPATAALASPASNGSVSFNPSTGAATYTHDGSATTSDSFTYTVMDDEGAESNEATVSVTITPGVDPGAVLFRVNAGGPVISDPGGDWTPDTVASPSAYANVPASGNSVASTGQTINTSHASIPAGTPQAMFKTERWDPPAGSELEYSFPVQAGSDVEVRMYFSENYNGITAPGQRTFDVSIDGQLVLNDYDPFAVAGGKFIGRCERFTIVSDGVVDVMLDHMTENPSIKGIEIVLLGDEPEDGALATLEVTPDGPLGVGTGNARAFRLSNNSTLDEKIERVRISLGGTVLPDMIFDPFGGAGDAQALAFTPTTDPGVGVGSAEYLAPHNGVDGVEGFDALQVTFTDFDPGETLEFSIDIDPLSIHGHPSPSPAGPVSGLEIAGATVEVEFDSGVVRTAELTPVPGVAGGARAVLEPARPSAPSVTLDTIGAGPGLVLSPTQTVRVSGAPSANVRVFVVEGQMRPDGVPGGAYDLDPFEANTAVVVGEYPLTLDGSGQGAVDVTLTRTPAPEGEAGLNHVFAVVEGAAASDLSNVVVADLRSIGTGQTVLYRVNAGGPSILSPDGQTPDWQEDQAVASGDAGGPANPGTPSPFVNSAQTDKTGGTNGVITLGPTVPAGTPTQIFKTERWDHPAAPEMLWSFPVQAGATIEVRLYLAEIYNGITSPGQRVFDVLIEGQLAMAGVDRFAESGGQKIGLVRSHTLIAPDSMLQVQLGHVAENPAICGIEIVQLASAGEAPIAGDDSATVATGGAVYIQVLANDSDADGDIDPSSVSVLMQPSSGSASVNPATGAITYTHNGDGSKADSFAYSVGDATGATSNAATVTIIIGGGGGNQPPVAGADAAPFNPGATAQIDVLANDSDADGSLNPASVTIVTQPAYGTASVDTGTGAISYSNTDDTASLDSLAYTVADDLGAVSAPATVNLTANTAPIAADDAAVVIENDSVDIDVLANDTDDGDLDASSVTVTSQPQFGSASVDPVTGEITYTHDGTPVASDALAYTVRDTGGRESDPATVTVTISAVDDGVLIESGLVLRLESDQGLADSGGQVTGWADQSATGAQTLPVGGPTLLPAAVNGLDAVGFDGVDDAIETIDGFDALPSGGQDRSVFVIARYHTGGVGFAHGQAPSSCPAGNALGLSLGVDDADGTLVAGGACPDAAFDSDAPGADGAWTSHALLYSGGVVTHTRDGSVVDTFPLALETGVGPAVLGRALDGSAPAMVDVAAVLVYDRALTEPQRHSVERYLRIKYLNTPPTTGEDLAQVDRGGMVEIDVLANDADADGALDPASVLVVVPPAFGSADVDPGTGAVTYTHGGSLETQDELLYTVLDELGAASAPTLVEIDVLNPCPADLAVPLGTLDVSDIALFLELFAASDPAVDFADPAGIFDIGDVLMFLQLYTEGCP